MTWRKLRITIKNIQKIVKNKQLVIEWDWINLDGFELLPAITISEHSLVFKWLFFYIEFFHPINNVFDK